MTDLRAMAQDAMDSFVADMSAEEIRIEWERIADEPAGGCYGTAIAKRLIAVEVKQSFSGLNAVTVG